MPDTDIFALYGRQLALTIKQRRFPSGVPTTPDHPWRPLIASHEGVIPVGILGGGMASLYAGLMLASMGIPFQILEATDRIGGRCFTHHFEEEGDWRYYDVGAMRFPLPPDDSMNGPHKRLRKLFEYLGTDLLKYIPKTDQGRRYYNGVNARFCNKEETFRAKELNVPNPYILAGVDALTTDYIERLTRPLLQDMENDTVDGWKDFKNLYDRHSTRSYLQFVHVPCQELQVQFGVPATGLPTAVINWMETFDTSTGAYDRALTETVLEAIAFGVVGDNPEWRCIRGGASELAKETLTKLEGLSPRKLSDPPILVKKAPVTAIRAQDDKDVSPLIVTAGGKEYTFAHVISTVPLPSFARIDTSTLNISPMQRSAIRQLQYGPSTKIGMHFKSPWWKEDGQIGGQSFTDLPIRTVVYPSYGDQQESDVLLASYCWTSDAERLGSLIDTPSTKVKGIPFDPKKALDELVLRDLAAIHKVDIEFLREQLIETHSWDWSHGPWTGGAFALFGPGQYDLLYEALNATAAENRLQWAGELLSVRHAWIVGALDSAWAAVCKYLDMTDRGKLKGFYEKWGSNDEWREKPKVRPHDGEDEEESNEIPLGENLLFQIGFTLSPESDAFE